jgi:hypothetical protein
VNRWENKWTCPKGLSLIILSLLQKALERRDPEFIKARIRLMGGDAVRLIRFLSYNIPRGSE